MPVIITLGNDLARSLTNNSPPPPPGASRNDRARPGIQEQPVNTERCIVKSD